MTVGFVQELKNKNIQVNGISPSDTATESYKKYFPQYIKDAVSPEIIAKQAVILCSNKANNITGQIFVVKKDKSPFNGFHY